MSNSKIFIISISEMGLNLPILLLILSCSIFFIISFVISSKNMDNEGVLAWMLRKPNDWIGWKNK
tara:strand:- start:658 stop:852 length:195 start_codon:yes stop_codon:yes gene_type:complete